MHPKDETLNKLHAVKGKQVPFGYQMISKKP